MKIILVTIGNEFGHFCRMIITPFHNLTNNINGWMFARKITANLQALLPYAHLMRIMVVMVWLLPKPVIFLASNNSSYWQFISKIVNLCDDNDASKNSKFIAYSLICVGCIGVFFQSHIPPPNLLCSTSAAAAAASLIGNYHDHCQWLQHTGQSWMFLLGPHWSQMMGVIHPGAIDWRVPSLAPGQPGLVDVLWWQGKTGDLLQP